MRRATLFAVLFSISALSTSIGYAKGADCTAPFITKLAFSSPNAPDTLMVSIRGGDCAKDAQMRLTITSAAGATLYSDQWPLSNFYDWANEKPRKPADAIRLVTPTLEEMPEYPSSSAIKADPNLIEGDFAVYAPAQFDRARKTGAPVICYLTSMVEASCAWIDPKTGVAIKLYGYAG